jgi:phage gp29-like protein
MGRYVRYINTRQRRIEKPRPGVFVSDYREDYAIDTGRLRLTPERLARVFRLADLGDLRQLQEVFNGVEEDPHVASCLGKRKRRMLSRPLEITAAVEDDDKAQQAAELCRAVVEGDQGEEGISGWRKALWVLADAIGRGFALTQIVWDTHTPGFVTVGDSKRMLLARPRELRRWPQRDCSIGDPENEETSSDEVRILTRADQTRGEALAPNGWVLHISKAREDGLAKAALLRAGAWWWLFKHYGIRDWTIHSERYGMPTRVGTYPPNANDDERQAVLDAVITIGKDAGVAIPEGAKIELLETTLKGESPYPKLIEICNFELSKLILGGTLTTESGDKGARALGEVHERTEGDIAEQDGKALAETIQQQLLRPIVEINLGAGYPVPRVAFVSTEQDALKERAERDKILAVDIKLPMTKAYFYEQYGVTAPEEGDELVNEPAEEAQPETPPPPPPPGGNGVPPATKEEEEEMDEQLNRAVADAMTILGDDLVMQLRAAGTPARAILALAADRKKKRSMPWVTPTR